MRQWPEFIDPCLFLATPPRFPIYLIDLKEAEKVVFRSANVWLQRDIWIMSATLPSAGILQNQTLGREQLQNWFVLQRFKKKILMSCNVFQPLVLVEDALHQVYTAATWCESVWVHRPWANTHLRLIMCIFYFRVMMCSRSPSLKLVARWIQCGFFLGFFCCT